MHSLARRTMVPLPALLAGLLALPGCNRPATDDAATPPAQPAEDAMQSPSGNAPADPAPAPSPPITDPVPPEPAPSSDPVLPPPADGASTDALPPGDQPQPAEPVPQPVDR